MEDIHAQIDAEEAEAAADPAPTDSTDEVRRMMDDVAAEHARTWKPRPGFRPGPAADPATTDTCICPRFKDTGGYRIADLQCPIHGVDGSNPGDGPWEEDT